MLEPGNPVPTVEALDQDGEHVSLEFSEPTVLYFYPRDDTPGCTTEAQQFDMELETYKEAGVAVYGVSTDSVDSHCDFAEKYDLGFPLLADPDGDVAEAFGLDVSGGTAPRTTFVLVDGEVRAVYRGVKPDGHAREVLMDMLDDGLVTLDA